MLLANLCGNKSGFENHNRVSFGLLIVLVQVLCICGKYMEIGNELIKQKSKTSKDCRAAQNELTS